MLYCNYDWYCHLLKCIRVVLISASCRQIGIQDGTDCPKLRVTASLMFIIHRRYLLSDDRIALESS